MLIAYMSYITLLTPINHSIQQIKINKTEKPLTTYQTAKKIKNEIFKFKFFDDFKAPLPKSSVQIINTSHEILIETESDQEGEVILNLPSNLKQFLVKVSHPECFERMPYKWYYEGPKSILR